MTLLWTGTYSIRERLRRQRLRQQIDFQSTRAFLAASFTGSTVTTEDLCLRGPPKTNTGSTLPNLAPACTQDQLTPEWPRRARRGVCTHNPSQFLGQTSDLLSQGSIAAFSPSRTPLTQSRL
jgi:hypothetical protein